MSSTLPKSVPPEFRAIESAAGGHIWDIDVEVVADIYSEGKMPESCIKAAAHGFGVLYETLMEGMTEENVRKLLKLRFRAGYLDALMEAIGLVPGITAAFASTGHMTGKITITPDSTFTETQWRYLAYLINDYKRKSFHLYLPIKVAADTTIYTGMVVAQTVRLTADIEDENTQFLVDDEGALLTDEEGTYLVVE